MWKHSRIQQQPMTKLSSKPQKSIHLTVKISNENTNAVILVLKQRLTEKILFACSTGQVFLITCLSYPELPKKTNKQTYKPKKTTKLQSKEKHKTQTYKTSTGVFFAWACATAEQAMCLGLTTGFAFIKMARLKAIIAIILLVGLGKCARDLTKCVVCKKKTLTWS